ncbi:MAG: ester cyclase [Burkholderiaceae bacterium]|nr:ester cyclase [Burkholderiaceae bacterium]
MKTSLKTVLLAALIAVGAGQAMAQTNATTITTATGKDMITPLLSDLARYQADEKRISKNITTFDNLDFDVFTHQKWDRLHESHSKDVVVHWPDGHQTKGIDIHIADLKAMFVYAPDTRIETHPVKFGQGEWTAVIGVMEGTFTKPMPIGDGKTIAPTGKSFKLTMATVGHWKGDTMDEEYLFWDNATYMKQLGLSN